MYSKKMQLDFHEFLQQNKSFNIESLNLDIKENKEKAGRLNVFQTPTMIMFKNNEPYCRAIGSCTKDDLYGFYQHNCDSWIKEKDDII